ncbi:hypothetical protein F4776DRAFT_628518 [Hypoxylon sp. NC0597]|nr:hypothetical protein F4776DRAFT_628518 [Hypoxylon sp. NC0597]
MLPQFHTITILFPKAGTLLEWMQVFALRGTRNFFWIAGLLIFNLSCRPPKKS